MRRHEQWFNFLYLDVIVRKQWFVAAAILLVPLLLANRIQSRLVRTGKGSVVFVSRAPLEVIKAESSELKGALDLENKSFEFVLRIKSFEGFNSPLQRDHFNENYLESESFPNATFKGKLIEDLPSGFSAPQTLRAKGNLTIHNITKEVILPIKLVSKNAELEAQSNFKVLLKDYNIKVPRIVSQKISEEIDVSVKLTLVTR